MKATAELSERTLGALDFLRGGGASAENTDAEILATAADPEAWAAATAEYHDHWAPEELTAEDCRADLDAALAVIRAGK